MKITPMKTGFSARVEDLNLNLADSAAILSLRTISAWRIVRRRCPHGSGES